MDRSRIVEAADVLGKRFGRDGAGSTRGPEETGSQIALGVAADQRLRKGGRLDQEEPAVVLLGELGRHYPIRQGHDIEEGGASNAIRVLDGEAIVSECLHGLSLIERTGALRVVSVVLAIGRLAAVAVSAKLHQHNGEQFGEFGRDLVPLDVRPWIAVNQQ